MDERKGARMLNFSSMVDGRRVGAFMPTGGEHAGIAIMFKPVEGLEPMIWTVASVAQDEQGMWHITHVHGTNTDFEQAFPLFCELTGFVPGETSD